MAPLFGRPMHPTWTEQWWPISYLQDLDPQRPNRFTLLERDLVIWWDQQGESWRVFPDVCPHRLVPLSEGRINDAGQLECPYHGWSFDGDGQCRQIPQALENTQPDSRRSRCASLPTASAQGLLFVWMGSPDSADPEQLPLVPALEENPDSWTVQDTFRDLPMDAVTLLENVLDVSHVPFTHHKTVGKRENAAPVEATITAEDASGFKAYWEEGPRRGKLGAQSTTFLAPQLMWHDLTAKGFGRILTVVYAVPIRRGEVPPVCTLPVPVPVSPAAAADRPATPLAAAHRQPQGAGRRPSLPSLAGTHPGSGRGQRCG
jgi:phenylpropionate dioxygenase-like ring-hydroxylating dioxygenase large terminal subunit